MNPTYPLQIKFTLAFDDSGDAYKFISFINNNSKQNVYDGMNLLEEIGSGGNGCVYKIEGSNMLIKCIKHNVNVKKLYNLYKKVASESCIMKVCNYVESDHIENDTYDEDNKIFLIDCDCALIIINEGASFADILQKLKGKEEDVIKNAKYNILHGFVDCVINLNNKYIHTDLKIDNVVFKEDNGSIKATLIDLDHLVEKNILKKQVKQSNILACSGNVYSIEVYQYDKLLSMEGKFEHAEFIKIIEDLFASDKYNYVGIFSIIFTIITEYDWYIFLFYIKSIIINKIEKDMYESLTNLDRHLITNFMKIFYEENSSDFGEIVEERVFIIFLLKYINYDNLPDPVPNSESQTQPQTPVKKVKVANLGKNKINVINYLGIDESVSSTNSEINSITKVLKEKNKIKSETVSNLQKTIGDSIKEQINQINQIKKKENQDITIDVDKLYELMRIMLCVDVNSRPGSDEIKKSLKEILKLAP